MPALFISWRVIVTGSRDSSIEQAKAVLGDKAIYLKNDAADPDAAPALAEALKANGITQIDGVF